MDECKLCNQRFNNQNSVRRHVGRKHPETSLRDYIVQHELGGIHPTCECGCGAHVSFYKNKFGRFVRGHMARVPHIRQQIVEGGRSVVDVPGFLEMERAQATALWRDETYKAKQAASRSDLTAPYNTTRHANLKKAHAEPELRRANSVRTAAWWQSVDGEAMRIHMASDEFKRICSEATRVALAAPETRKRLSDAVREAIRVGRFVPKSNWPNTKKGYVRNPTSGLEEWHESGWELEFSELLTRASVEYDRSSDLLRVPYVDGALIDRDYYPDYHLPAFALVVEVKGRLTEDDPYKFMTARRFYASIGLEYVVVLRNEFDVLLERVSP